MMLTIAYSSSVCLALYYEMIRYVKCLLMKAQWSCSEHLVLLNKNKLMSTLYKTCQMITIGYLQRNNVLGGRNTAQHLNARLFIVLIEHSKYKSGHEDINGFHINLWLGPSLAQTAVTSLTNLQSTSAGKSFSHLNAQ